MSAKWRALQHRHRFTYSSVIFPKSFVEALKVSALDACPSSDFLAKLKDLASLTSTYSQVSAAKNLAASFTQLLTDVETSNSIVSIGTRLYLEILFLENSLPLHRTLISTLGKTRKFQTLIGDCFLSLCEEYGDLDRKGKKRFVVSRAVLSVMGYPKLGFLNESIEKCSHLVAMDVANGLESVISEMNGGSRPSPEAMEQCQEAMSCLYYLLQKFPSKFVSSESTMSMFEMVVRIILSVLRSSAFSRDCLAAAGVSFCAALQACMSPGQLLSFISKALYGFCGFGGVGVDLDAKRLLPGGDIYRELGDLSVLSRLCLLRGILTAVPRTILNTQFSESIDGHVWTILYGGILPELCKYCENPIDSHFNFHSLTVIQICLQQIKTSIFADLIDFSGDYNPLPEHMTSRILKIVWNNLGDPLSQTVKQVHLIFDLLLDIKLSFPSGEGNGKTNLFLGGIATDLLKLGPRCKGRYMPLASLTKRLGANSLLDLNSNLLFETMSAYIDDDVCCSATSFLKCFLECLRDECWSSNGIERGYETFRDLCLPPLLKGLVSGQSKLRSNLNTYALPVVLDVDVDSIFSMLAYISVGPNREGNKFSDDLNTDQRVAALVSLFKVSRSLALIEGDIDLDNDSWKQKNSASVVLVCVKGVNVRVLVDWFLLALTHDDESLRIDAAESLFLNPRTSSLPSALELRLMRKMIPLNMRCCSTAFQMKWSSLFRKFFSRVRTALERQVKQGLWQPDGFFGANLDGHHDEAKDLVICRAEDLFHFIKWLSSFLLYSCYPSAPYERKIMAMELILIMLDVWPSNSSTQVYYYLYPYTDGFASPESTLSLVGSIVDSWDRLRENSFRILSCFPTPLPGITSHDSVTDLIRWAKKLVCSPRVRESDAGALTFRLIFKKYVLELGWIVGVSDNVVCLSVDKELFVGDSHNYKFGIPVIEYISSLIDWLCILVGNGEKDLSEACRNSFVHGVLLTLRYTFEEVDWNSEVILSSSNEMRLLLEKLFELVMRITSLALWVVSADAWHMPNDMDDMVDDAAFLSGLTIEIDASGSFSDQEDDKLRSVDGARPPGQVVMVGCWLAMKEVSLLLGTIIRKIPLPCCSFSVSSGPGSPLDSANGEQLMSTYNNMLDLKQLETIGDHFLQVLLKMKHNGAIDKTRAGFTALCNRLLCSNDPRLCKMTESWMERLMERTTAKGQTVDDLLRRSAGIPAAFIAFFLAEPAGAPKKLLPRALRWLIEVANMTLTQTCMNSDENNESPNKISLDEPDKTLIKPAAEETNGSRSAFKRRDEGVVPTVHAFNVLRAAFNDTNLATDISGFSAEALIVSICSFSSPYWEVRNSACLAYTALVRRMIGFLNIQKRESARRALTGLEFFHRYPALHPFLFDQLKIATELLGDGSSEHMESNISKAIHPSLCPILILLSRLKPSPISSGADDVLDPFLFMPFIKRCATQSNLRVRVLASRALTGLVSNEKLLTVLRGVADALPHGRHRMEMPQDLGLVSSDLVAMENGHETGTRHSSFNSIHGTLLQLHSLLDANCRNLSDVTKKAQIVSELTQMLRSCSWIGSFRSCPCPTLNTSFLLVLNQMLDIARSHTLSQLISPIQTLLVELTSECLDIERSYKIAFHDPTRIELRRQAAASYFSCVLGGTDPEGPHLHRLTPSSSCKYRIPVTETSVMELQERIVSCLSDSTYEVRLATLKKVFSMLKHVKPSDSNSAIQIWAKNYLQQTMLQSLVAEENPKCIYYILNVIFSWSNLQDQKPSELECQNSFYFGMDRDSIFSFWDRLLHLNSTVTRMKTREILLCCMSICVKQFARIIRSCTFIDQSQINGDVGSDSSGIDGPNGWVKAYECIHFFIDLVKLHSAPSEPVNMRKAAAESIVASGLLEEAGFVASFVSSTEFLSEEQHVYNIEETSCSLLGISEVRNLYACRVLDVWFTCIQLLEDEDIELRQRLAKNIQKCVTPKESDRSHCSDTGPTQVDKVIELSFEFLSSIFGHWLKYLDYLLSWVSNCASFMEPHGDLVRTIFDKEIDNHHEEKLLICQICCYQLEKLLHSRSSEARMQPENLSENNIEMFLQRWRLRFVRRLISFANKCLETKDGTDWIGGIGNHKDAFAPLYANMLGLYALKQHGDNLHCSSDQSSDAQKKLYVSEFMEFKRIVKPYIGNPLISNLYCLLIQESHHDCSTWKNFDPYFLLR